MRTWQDNNIQLGFTSDCYKGQKNVWQCCWWLCSCLIPECYRTQKKCDKAVDSSLSEKQFVPDFYKVPEMCYKTVDTCVFVFNYVPDYYTTQEMCNIVVSKENTVSKILSW